MFRLFLTCDTSLMSYNYLVQDKIIGMEVTMGARKLNNKLNVIGSNLTKYRTMRNLSQARFIKKLKFTWYTNE